MSVKTTVARTSSGTGPPDVPVMKSCSSRRIGSVSLVKYAWSPGPRSTSSAPSMWSAMYCDQLNGVIRSSLRQMTRVGTLIAGSAARTSMRSHVSIRCCMPEATDPDAAAGGPTTRRTAGPRSSTARNRPERPARPSSWRPGRGAVPASRPACRRGSRRRRTSARVRAVEHQLRQAVGMRGREHDRGRPALGEPDERGALQARRVHDRERRLPACSSIVAARSGRSDSPWPRLSKTTTRANAPTRSKKRSTSGCSRHHLEVPDEPCRARTRRRRRSRTGATRCSFRRRSSCSGSVRPSGRWYRRPIIEHHARSRARVPVDRRLGLRRRRGDPGGPQGVRPRRRARHDRAHRAHRPEHDGRHGRASGRRRSSSSSRCAPSRTTSGSTP